jgi:hypothetical protein
MADIVIQYTDIHNLTSLTNVHIDPGGRLSSLLDIIICVMIAMLLYVIGCAYEQCSIVCGSRRSDDEEVVTARLMPPEQEMSSH